MSRGVRVVDDGEVAATGCRGWGVDPAEGMLDVARAGFGAIHDHTVEFPYVLTDASPYRDRVFSCLRLVAEDAHRCGLERMERDLLRGPIPCVSRYTLVWGSGTVRTAAAALLRQPGGA